MTRWVLVCMTMLWTAPAVAAEPPATSPATSEAAPEAADETKPGRPDGLPLPRFVSLRANPVNLRVGPSASFPIEWIYVRRNLPVEIIAEFDTWRRIKDPAGTEGWVHSSMLSGRRTAMVTGEVRTLHRAMDPAADVVAQVAPGVVVEVLRCPDRADYCRVEANGLQGWLKRDQLWGVYSHEVID